MENKFTDLKCKYYSSGYMERFDVRCRVYYEGAMARPASVYQSEIYLFYEVYAGSTIAKAFKGRRGIISTDI